MPGPWQSHEETLVDEALQRIALTPAQIRRIKPPVPRAKVPTRRGQPTIEDVMSVNRSFPTYRSWMSGGPPDLTRTSFEEGQWTGASRYSMQEVFG